jgi:hypothetical protein
MELNDRSGSFLLDEFSVNTGPVFRGMAIGAGFFRHKPGCGGRFVRTTPELAAKKPQGLSESGFLFLNFRGLA